MATAPLVPVIDKTRKRPTIEPALEIELDDFQRAQSNPRVKALLEDAVAEGARLEDEGRIRW
jgi:hypothetical protein